MKQRGNRDSTGSKQLNAGENMGNTFFIADTHFYHENIIKYENRPFKSIEEMTEVLVENWNSKVNKDDKVFMLGDFAFHPKIHINELVPRLKGNKVLIIGNHDCVSVRAYMDSGFKEVYKYPIIFEKFWMLSHEPLYINDNMPYANIFGHVHSNPEYADYSPQSICVSVERKHMNYYPISFDEVKSLMGISDSNE